MLNLSNSSNFVSVSVSVIVKCNMESFHTSSESELKTNLTIAKDIDTGESYPSNVTEYSESEDRSQEGRASIPDGDTHQRPHGVSFHFKIVTLILVPLVCCGLLCCIFCAQSRDWLRGFLGMQYTYRESYAELPSQGVPRDTQTVETLNNSATNKGTCDASKSIEPIVEPQMQRVNMSYGSILDSSRTASDKVIMEVKDKS